MLAASVLLRNYSAVDGLAMNCQKYSGGQVAFCPHSAKDWSHYRIQWVARKQSGTRKSRKSWWWFGLENRHCKSDPQNQIADKKMDYLRHRNKHKGSQPNMSIMWTFLFVFLRQSLIHLPFMLGKFVLHYSMFKTIRQWVSLSVKARCLA